jgi:predicted N-acyltransferase
MNVELLRSLEEIDAGAWNRLAPTDQPFLRHEFLVALERHGAVGSGSGWQPCHLLLRDGGQALGAVPLYLKSHSQGEFVFDWSWAAASQRLGQAYYPKLVSAVPFTPVTGTRLLLRPGLAPEPATMRLSRAALDMARARDLSSLHWLFPGRRQAERLCEDGLLLRIGCQFHWRNRGYTCFEDFLGSLNSKRRKEIRRERRQVERHGFVFRIRRGTELSDGDWRHLHAFYLNTFQRQGGYATLPEAFFREISASLGNRLVAVIAFREERPVAAALCVQGERTLYGRYWGCSENHPMLHFETCYYQGIEHCIREGLQRFEPGAQGEHKLSRGFLPTLTYSVHWIRHGILRDAVRRFLEREAAAVRSYRTELLQHSPYRCTREPV